MEGAGRQPGLGLALKLPPKVSKASQMGGVYDVVEISMISRGMTDFVTSYDC